MIYDWRLAIWLKRIGLTLALLSALNPQISTAFAQGSLTPPGAPAPTMKTLSQIEPRALISSAPFTISTPGSYYLTTNISVSSGTAVSIATNGVTLDLNGFTISSTEASPAGTGILIGGGLKDINISKGHIRGAVVYSGSGFANGICFSNASPPLNVQVTDVSVSGCLDDGIHLGSINSTLVESCTVFTVGGYGIVASSVLRSTAKSCGNVAISADTAADSYGSCSGSGDGLDATFSANNCTGSSTSGVGVNAATANNCYGASLTGDGIRANVAGGCQGSDLAGSGNGIYANTAPNCWGTASGSGSGVLVSFFAESCYGSSGSVGYGVYSGGTAQNCYGTSNTGTGINATTAQNCQGNTGGSGVVVAGISCQNALNCYGSSSGSAYGIYASISTFNSYGYSSSGTGLSAFLANSCVGDTSGGTPYSVTHNINTFVNGL